MNIGEAVSLARNNIGLSQKDLAEKIGKSDSFISRLEKDKRSPSLQTLQKIAEALSFKLSQLLTIVESVLDPKDEIRMLQRNLLLAVQPILAQR